MLTFREFYSICEGQKKEERQMLVRAYLAGTERATPTVVNYGDSAPNSPERKAQIAAMMKNQGGGAVRKALKTKLKQAKKAAKAIQKEEQFFEDIEKRRKQLRQRQLDQANQFRERSASYRASLAAAEEKENLKKEIKKELQNEN